MSFSDRGMQLLAALRQKRKDAAANAKPVFGPPPSKAIFESKWLTKLDTYHQAFRAVEPDEMASYMSLALDLVIAFHTEARNLGLKEADLTTELNIPEVNMGNCWDVVYINPFSPAEVLQTEINCTIKDWKLVVESKKPKIPKARLRDYEDFLVKAFEAEEAGLWDSSVDEELYAEVEAEVAAARSKSQVSGSAVSQVPAHPKQRRKWW